jgi:hypothetical protein
LTSTFFSFGFEVSFIEQNEISYPSSF